MKRVLFVFGLLCLLAQGSTLMGQLPTFAWGDPIQTKGSESFPLAVLEGYDGHTLVLQRITAGPAKEIGYRFDMVDSNLQVVKSSEVDFRRDAKNYAFEGFLQLQDTTWMFTSLVDSAEKSIAFYAEGFNKRVMGSTFQKKALLKVPFRLDNKPRLHVTTSPDKMRILVACRSNVPGPNQEATSIEMRLFDQDMLLRSTLWKTAHYMDPNVELIDAYADNEENTFLLLRIYEDIKHLRYVKDKGYALMIFPQHEKKGRLIPLDNMQGMEIQHVRLAPYRDAQVIITGLYSVPYLGAQTGVFSLMVDPTSKAKVVSEVQKTVIPAEFFKEVTHDEKGTYLFTRIKNRGLVINPSGFFYIAEAEARVKPQTPEEDKLVAQYGNFRNGGIYVFQYDSTGAFLNKFRIEKEQWSMPPLDHYASFSMWAPGEAPQFLYTDLKNGTFKLQFVGWGYNGPTSPQAMASFDLDAVRPVLKQIRLVRKGDYVGYVGGPETGKYFRLRMPRR